MEEAHLQQNQPAGVPPLALTGERTLPDVPEENYWFRRHLAVYEWIAERVRGAAVADLACGEGYGSDVLAERAAEVVGVDANPEAHEHARLRYRRPNLRFERTLVERFDEPRDAIVFLQTIEHVERPRRPAGALLRARRRSPTSRPRTGSRSRPEGAEKSDNPWHLREYTAAEYLELVAPHFASVELYGVFHAGKLRAARAGAEGRAGTASTRRCGSPSASTTASCPRSPPRTSRFAARPSCDLDRALDFIAVCRS